MSKTIAYLRVSTDEQDLKTQKFAILEYCDQHKLQVDKWVELSRSSQSSQKERRIEELLSLVSTGDRVVISELSRLGRSTGEVIQLVNSFVERKAELIVIKQGLRVNGKSRRDMSSKIIITIFSLLAELERDLLSERTKMGMARAKAAGKKLGRPKGPGKSKLDGKEEDIKELANKGVTRANIARMLGVSWGTLDTFIKQKMSIKPVRKELKVSLYLRVENNSKFVRGKKRVREEIEQFYLSDYQMQKPDKNGWEYELMIPYQSEEDLEQTISELFQGMESTADLRHCFIEGDLRALDGSERFW